MTTDDILAAIGLGLFAASIIGGAIFCFLTHPRSYRASDFTPGGTPGDWD